MRAFWPILAAACGSEAGGAAADAGGSGGDAASDAASDAAPDAGRPLDDVLRVNHIQAEGSHNGYHVAAENPISLLDYTHAPLGVQLAEQGVRHTELDVHYDPDEGFLVYHIPTFDEGTTCRLFVECLATIRDWSDANPEHHVLFVLVEPKDKVDAVSIVGHYDELEAEVLSVFDAARVVTPDEVRDGRATLREAVTGDGAGWPTLGATRGRLAFVLWDGGVHRDEYTSDAPALEGKLLFTRSEPDRDDAAVLAMDDPLDKGDAIPDAVAQGFVVRTRADADVVEPAAGDTTRLDAALASGAHLVSTDFPAPVEGVDYFVEMPGGAPSRCNPVTAPPDCTPGAIE